MMLSMPHTREDSVWWGLPPNPQVWPLDSLHVVGGVEAHAPVLPSLAPALLILILQLFKLIPCNIICVIDCNIVVTWAAKIFATDLFWRWARPVPPPRSRRAPWLAPLPCRRLWARSRRRPTPRTRRRTGWRPSLRYWNRKMMVIIG